MADTMTGKVAARWAVITLVSGLLVGWPLALFAGCLACWHLLRAPAPESVLRAAALLMALVPATWFVVNRHRFGTVTFDLASANRVPSYVAAAGLLTLVVGVVRDVLAHPDSFGEAVAVNEKSS